MSAGEENTPSPPELGEGVVEATGETVGEAKWAALRELERLHPGLEKAEVSFEVLSEGERGLLGVGYLPARVIARAERGAATPEPAPEEPGTPPAKLREFLARVCTALELPGTIAIGEDEEQLLARVSGPDLGLLIGKRGQTIDAIQYLANAVVWRHDEDRKQIVVDAAGYRARRRSTLERIAERAAADAVRSGMPVALEPMSAVERKIVHLCLQERGDVETSSEGTEPNRHVVVSRA